MALSFLKTYDNCICFFFFLYINIEPDRSYSDWQKARIQCTRCAPKHRLGPLSCRSSALRKLDVKKQRSQRTAEAFSAQLSDKFRRSPSNLSDIGGLWVNICHLLRTTAVLRSLVSSAHPNEINGTIRSVARGLITGASSSKMRMETR